MEALTIPSDQISMGLDAVTPHVASGSVYDVFATSGAAVCAGPAWSSTTSRGTGAGTTELQLKSGIWTNKNSLTHCWGGASGTTDLGALSANQGTYLGSFYGTAAGQTGMAFTPAAGTGGSNTFLALYNAYNRIVTGSRSADSTASWSYNSATWRAANASNSNRISFLDGLQQSSLTGTYFVCVGTANATANTGVDLDSTSNAPKITTQTNVLSTALQTAVVTENFSPVLGLHFVQAVESGAASPTFFGAQTTPTRQLNSLAISLEM